MCTHFICLEVYNMLITLLLTPHTDTLIPKHFIKVPYELHFVDKTALVGTAKLRTVQKL